MVLEKYNIYIYIYTNSETNTILNRSNITGHYDQYYSKQV